MKKTKEDSPKSTVSEEEKTKQLAKRYNVPYIDLSSHIIDRELVQSFPADFLHRSNFVPFERNKTSLRQEYS